MKSWSCSYCPVKVSELGSYVRIGVTTYAHLPCYDQEQFKKFVLTQVKELAQKNLDDAERQKEAAIAVWRAAPRCPKCGVPMLSERPAGLPETFSYATPGSGGSCTLCVRQEAGLRAAARGREAPPPAPKTTPLYAPEELRDMGAPQKSADEELIRKAKMAGTPAIEIE